MRGRPFLRNPTQEVTRMHIYFLLLMLVVIGLVAWQISKRLR